MGTEEEIKGIVFKNHVCACEVSMIKFKEQTLWVRTANGELYEMINETDVFFILISNNIMFHRDKTSFKYLYEYVGEL